jgi:hypothetical protein
LIAKKITISKKIPHKIPTTIPVRFKIVLNHPEVSVAVGDPNFTPDSSGHSSAGIE